MTFSWAPELPKGEKVEKLHCKSQLYWFLVIYIAIYIDKSVPVMSLAHVSIFLALPSLTLQV